MSAIRRMNVDLEIAAAMRRIQAQIDRSARAALIRFGVDPDEEERKARLASLTAEGEQVGEAFRAFVDGITAFMAGWNRAFDRGSDS